MNLQILNCLLIVLAFSFVFTAVLSIGNLRRKKENEPLQRLLPWLKRNTIADPSRETLSLPLSERLLKPGIKHLSQLFGRWLPSKTSSTLTQRLIQAGSPGWLNASEFTALQYAATFGLAIAAVIISSLLTSGVFTSMSIAALFGVLGYFLPDLILRYRIKQRQEAAIRILPDVLDLLLVSVEAGLGFDGALQKVTEKSRGVLSEEFVRLLNEIRMGKPRREALRDMSNRIGTDEFASFVGAIIQAEQLGVSIGNVLRLQAAQMRQMRRQRAEEKAMKAPVKMLFPLVFFIFPTLFVVILGPAAINLMTSFIMK